jgi:hypothetical protein
MFMRSKCGQYVVRLLDGLGNQLFQYALGRKLSIEHSAGLVFDVAWYRAKRGNAQPRELALRSFNVQGEFDCNNLWQAYWVRPTRVGRLWWRLEQNLLPPHWRRFVQQSPDDFMRAGRMFDPRILRLRPGSYLFGWWLSPKYFEGIEDQLRRELVLGQRTTARTAEFRERVLDRESVAIHIRRGDYINHPSIGILGPAYYKRAIQIIRDRTIKPKFFVFSDDVTAAQELLRGILSDYQVVQLEPGVSPAMDLWVMAGCKHFINANSTFSWWGAWLSSHINKTVIVPQNWFVGAGIEVADIYPAEWLRISVG